MNDPLERLESEIHDMRGDFKTVAAELTKLTIVMTRKEENDRFLERRLEKLEANDAITDGRIRKCEDFITRSSPWVTLASRVVIALVVGAALIWVGIR